MSLIPTVIIKDTDVAPETLRLMKKGKAIFRNSSTAQVRLHFGGSFFDELSVPDNTDPNWYHKTIDPGADLEVTATNVGTAEDNNGVKTKAHRYVIEFLGKNKSFPKQGMPGPHDPKLADDSAVEPAYRPTGDDPHLIIE